jgi:hypothetical protein
VSGAPSQKLLSSPSFLSHPKPEAAYLVLVDELNFSPFRNRLAAFLDAWNQ